MTTTDSVARVTNRRQLPLDEMRDISSKLYAALHLKDDENGDLAVALLKEWLVMSGHDVTAPFQFTFAVRKQPMDFGVDITCRAKFGDESYSATRSSGYIPHPKNDTPGELVRCGASLLLGIECAIQECARKLLSETVFPNRDIDFRKEDALYMLATGNL
jgi:hypothetical protein